MVSLPIQFRSTIQLCTKLPLLADGQISDNSKMISVISLSRIRQNGSMLLGADLASRISHENFNALLYHYFTRVHQWYLPTRITALGKIHRIYVGHSFCLSLNVVFTHAKYRQTRFQNLIFFLNVVWDSGLHLIHAGVH